jgi:hypothetical protein
VERVVTQVGSPTITGPQLTGGYARSVLSAHQEWELGTVEAGTWVRVTLWGAACDVLLLTPADRDRFLADQPFAFVGGHFQGSRVRLVVPTTGVWHVMVVPDPMGTVQASVQLSRAA